MNPIVDDDTEEESGISANKIVGTDNSASYQFVKRQRRRTSSRDRSRSISITVATFDYSSSGDETIYSAQGNYTCTLHRKDKSRPSFAIALIRQKKLFQYCKVKQCGF